MVTKEYADNMLLDSTVESGKRRTQALHGELLGIKAGTHELIHRIEDGTNKEKLMQAEEELQKAIDATMQALLTFRSIQNDQTQKYVEKLNQLVKKG